MLKIDSPLTAQTEQLISRVIGCAIEVHKAIGPGFAESIYKRALCIEFDASGVPYDCERVVRLLHRGQPLGTFRLDVLVGNEVVVEVKSVERLLEVHRVQIRQYMRVSNIRAGLLMNFNVPVLPDGLKRFVL